MLGRKVYFRYGDKVMAVETYAETPEAFKERTGIDVIDHTVAEVASLVDCAGGVFEMRVGKSVEKLRYAEGIAEIITRRRLLMSEQDIHELINHSKVDLTLHQKEDIPDIDDNLHNYLTGSFYFGEDERKANKQSFVGYMEIPGKKESLLNGFLTLGCASFYSGEDQERQFVSVHLFKSGTFSFDTGKDTPENGEWVVLFYGVDNHSEGQRFKTEEEAKAFVARGWKAGFDKDLLYYNS